MPEFDISKLSNSELAAYRARLECGGTAEIDALFASIVQRVTAMQAEGKGPKEIVVTVVGDYFDPEPLTMGGPIIRYETIRHFCNSSGVEFLKVPSFPTTKMSTRPRQYSLRPSNMGWPKVVGSCDYAADERNFRTDIRAPA